MKYFDKRWRREMEDRRKIADRRTGAPLADLIPRKNPVTKGDKPKSLRDEFAVAAMAALVAKNDGVMFPEQILERSYNYADAAMAARKAGEE